MLFLCDFLCTKTKQLLGELYNYRVVNSDIIFSQLYGILEYGASLCSISCSIVPGCTANVTAVVRACVGEDSS